MRKNKKMVEKGADSWFNEFQKVEDFMFHNKLWDEEDIGEKPSEALINGLKRLMGIKISTWYKLKNPEEVQIKIEKECERFLGGEPIEVIAMARGFVIAAFLDCTPLVFEQKSFAEMFVEI